MYYVKVWKLNNCWIMLFLECNVDALNIKRKFFIKKVKK